MSDDRDKGADALLGDLESIRTLLEENEAIASAGQRSDSVAAAADDDVPLLEDVVAAGDATTPADAIPPPGDSTAAGQDHAPPDAADPGMPEYPADPIDPLETTRPSGLTEQMFNALLGDQWRHSAREILDEARATIENHQTSWSPEHTDELNAALKVRIDETLQLWLRQVVQSRIDELRGELLNAVRLQLDETIARHFNPPSPNEDPDGE